jgi:hypothetical protein
MMKQKWVASLFLAGILSGSLASANPVFPAQGPWITEEVVSLGLTSEPSAVRTETGHVFVFYAGANGHLSYSDRFPRQPWGRPQDLGPTFFQGSPSSVAIGGDGTGVFLNARDGRLTYTEHQSGAQWWSGGYPGPMGIRGGSSPSAVMIQPNVFRVFYRGNDNRLWVVPFENYVWGTPMALGHEALGSDPSATAMSGQSYEIRVFYRGERTQFVDRFDHFMMVTFNAGNYQSRLDDLTPNARLLTSKPSALSAYPGHLDVFYANPGGQILRSFWPDQSGRWWSAPQSFAISIPQGVSAVAVYGQDDLSWEMFFRNPYGRLSVYHQTHH